MVACPPRPSKVGLLGAVWASGEPLHTANSSPGRTVRLLSGQVDELVRSVPPPSRSVAQGGLLFLACLWVGVSSCRVPIVACTSPESLLCPAAHGNSELRALLCVLTVAQPDWSLIAHSVNPRGFCSSGPRLLSASFHCVWNSPSLPVPVRWT